MEIHYEVIAGIPGYFTCPQYLVKVSTLYCADCHQKSKTKKYIQDNRRSLCRYCPIGSFHSGEIESINSSRLYGTTICARCDKPSNRLVQGRLCVSCYNRAAEAIKNKNAKGNPLKLIRDYHQASVMIICENTVKLINFDKVLSLKEAIFGLLLKNPDQFMFGESESENFFEKA
jgi:hypothetical protein